MIETGPKWFFVALALSSCSQLSDSSMAPTGATEDLLAAPPVYQPMFVVPMPELKPEIIPTQRLKTLVGRETPIRELLLTLFHDSDINLLVDSEVQGNLTFDIKNTSVEEAFEALLESQDLSYSWDGSFLRVKQKAFETFDVDLIDMQYSSNTGQGGSAGFGSSGNGSGSNSGTGGTSGSGQSLWTTLERDLRVIAGDNASLVVNRTAGTVSVEARPSLLKRIRTYLEHTVDRATNQVSIEARILEVHLRDEFQLGVNWSALPGLVGSSLTGTLAGGAFATQTASAGGGAFNFGLLKNDQFEVFVDALQSQGQVRVLSSPRVSTMNNVPATIRVVEQIPVMSREVIDSVGGLRTEYDIRFVDAGISVAVTPQIGVGGMITAQVTPRVVEQTGTVTTPDGLQTEPILSARETSTTVRVPNGEAIVIGGLRSTRKTEIVSGVPLLSDIPWLGSAFRSTRQSSEEVEMMVILVPRILDNAWMHEDLRRGAHRLVSLRRPFHNGTIGLESAQPEDWSGSVLGGIARDAKHVGTRVAGEPKAPAVLEGASLTVTRKGLASRFLFRAQAALARGQRRQAVSYLQKALELEPDRCDVLVLTGILMTRIDQVNEAKRLLRRASELKATDPEVLIARGLIEVELGSADAAMPFFLTAYQIEESPWTASNLAGCLLMKRDFETAHMILTKHEKQGKAFAEYFANFAYAKYQLGDLEGARQSFSRALTSGVDTRNPRIHALQVILGIRL